MRTKQANTAQIAVIPVRKGNYIKPSEDVSLTIERQEFRDPDELRLVRALRSKSGV